MNKRIDFTNLEGLAIYQDTLDFMQESYRASLAAVASAYGNYVILSGVADNGTSWGEGWVVIDGELMPFASGLKADNVIVEELTDTEIFGDDSTKTVYFTKRAKSGSVGGVAMADFIRLSSFRSLQSTLTNLVSTVAGLSLVPTGAIIMWSGAITAIPTGWALCNGSNGTPDLSGKFVVGYNSGDADYNAIGKAGGEKKHTLTVQEMPSHNHDNGAYNRLLKVDGTNTVASVDNGSIEPNVTLTASIQAQGGNQPHENRPPYYTLAYIMKL